MPDFVIISDIHAHAYPDSPILPDGRNKRLVDIVACLDAAREAAKKAKAPIISLGDMFHNRKGVPPEALQAVGDWLQRCRDDGVATHLLTGNHDLSIGGDGSSSVRSFSGTSSCHTAVGFSEISGIRFGWIPYMEDPEAVRAAAKRLSQDRCAILLAHLGLGDPRYADCVPSDYESPGRIGVNDLRPDDFAQVFLGHYHKYQRIIDNVGYVGSPLQLSFSEAGHEKGFVIYDTKKKSVDLCLNTWSPQFHKISASEAVAKLAHGEIKESDPVWVTGADADDAAALKKAGTDRGLAIRVEKQRVEAKRVRIDPSGRQADILKQYVQAAAPDTPNLVERVDVGLSLIINAAR